VWPDEIPFASERKSTQETKRESLKIEDYFIKPERDEVKPRTNASGQVTETSGSTEEKKEVRGSARLRLAKKLKEKNKGEVETQDWKEKDERKKKKKRSYNRFTSYRRELAVPIGLDSITDSTLNVSGSIVPPPPPPSPTSSEKDRQEYQDMLLALQIQQSESFGFCPVVPPVRAFTFGNGGSGTTEPIIPRLGRGRGSGGRGLYNLQFIQRDFTSDDYEMLLSLDQNKRNTKGATKEQIKSIKSHKVKSDTKLKNEQCSICLEDITGKQTNAKYKQLPCSHAYHPQCIDRWLAESRTCPVCSSEINFKEKTEKNS